jgi:hypothetical protein
MEMPDELLHFYPDETKEEVKKLRAAGATVTTKFRCPSCNGTGHA